MKIQESELSIMKNILKDEIVKDFFFANLNKSLADLELKNECIDDFIHCLSLCDFVAFHKKYHFYLEEFFSEKFYENLAPDYFEKHLFPYLSFERTLLDVGCGSGSLLRRIRKKFPEKSLVGIDVNSYPTWNKEIEFFVIEEKNFLKFIEGMEQFDVVMTWVLHHMSFENQVFYMSSLFEKMKSGSKVFIIEDSFSTLQQPLEGQNYNEVFSKFSKRQQEGIISVNDWAANRILAQRQDITIPLTFRTLEDWIELFEKIGFKVLKSTYIGFPKRDVYNPQSLIILQKS